MSNRVPLRGKAPGGKRFGERGAAERGEGILPTAEFLEDGGSQTKTASKAWRSRDWGVYAALNKFRIHFLVFLFG